MKKILSKLFRQCMDNPYIKFSAYFVGIIAVFAISGFLTRAETVWELIVSFISAQETLSIFLAGLLTLAVAQLFKLCEYLLEESDKITDNHHKIIHRYSGHAKQELPADENFLDKSGVFMCLHHVDKLSKKDMEIKEKDQYSKAYKNEQKDIEIFQNGTLYLPSLNVYANIQGNTKLVFDDKNELYQLPDFVIDNAANLLSAHKNSQTRNNDTIRLTDFSYQDGTLTLATQRSMYYHMLITNRCMDYAFYEGLSIRDLYEYDKRISLLSESKFGNQIGINGLILSRDGYVLIEKRDHKKTTWKNKFAQSISLALKAGDLSLTEDRTLKNTYQDANENLRHIITKTIQDNFGLTAAECDEFELQDNFLGLARDLLEGGKPNLYFYVTTKYTGEELAKKLIENAKKTDDDALQSGKLSSDYYLVPFDEIRINYQYGLKLDRKKCHKVYRRVWPRSSRIAYCWDKAKHKVGKKLKLPIKRECGEALLVTLSYLELCRSRIGAIKK